jgi:hypothetical protein
MSTRATPKVLVFLLTVIGSSNPNQCHTAKGLISVVNGQVKIDTDHTNVVANGSRGRDSVRIESKQLFNGGLFIADIIHMPAGCGSSRHVSIPSTRSHDKEHRNMACVVAVGVPVAYDG